MENPDSLNRLQRQDFIKIVDGKQVDLFTLKNQHGAEVAITNYGAKIVSLVVPGKRKRIVDVVLGKNSIDEYLNDQEPYFGAVCGRTANRIAKGYFRLDGKEYHLAINNGPNNLHGGYKGFNAVVWDARQIDSKTLELSYLSPDGEEGYPGNLSVTVTYTLTEENELKINYQATTDKATLVNLTNHSYFNLKGEGNKSIRYTQLEINADYYLPTNDVSIPLGLPELVEDTPFDFREIRPILMQIDFEHTQLIFGNGYDHTYILRKGGDGLNFCAKAYDYESGVIMEVFTTEPSVHFYTGNFLDGSFIAKNGHRYPRRSAFCLETQHFPDSIHHPDYPTTVLKPGETFRSETVYKFSLPKRFKTGEENSLYRKDNISHNL
ncbi:MAG: galactose mutarotase [Dysgonamonadaceae bacterium]|jgi:aldose 1-epimerase|nr:galactose mutarotase [Dysgonamonadaceae bacterium]